MLTVISPAKTLDFDTPATISDATTPALLDHAAGLADVIKKKSPRQLKNMMGISDNLAELNHERFQNWELAAHRSDNDPGTKQALLAFKGDVYLGLAAETLTKKQLLWTQDHLRILSGLYGVLRPLDRILPYRLEMGTSLKIKRAKDLYAYWDSLITEQIVEQLTESKSKLLLNLASNEYFSSVDADEIPVPIVSATFKEFKNGKYKFLSFFAKKARGTMAAWVIRNKVKTLKKLKTFAEDGYRFDDESSTDDALVFLRG